MLDQSLLDRLPLRGQKAGTDVLGEKMEKGNGVLNILEVGRDLDPYAEAPPLAPGGGVFLEDQMAFQPKFVLPHVVVSGVVGPHGCKYLTDQS